VGNFWKANIGAFGSLWVTFGKLTFELLDVFGQPCKCYLWELKQPLGRIWELSKCSKSFPKVAASPKVTSQKLPKSSKSFPKVIKSLKVTFPVVAKG